MFLIVNHYIVGNVLLVNTVINIKNYLILDVTQTFINHHINNEKNDQTTTNASSNGQQEQHDSDDPNSNDSSRSRSSNIEASGNLELTNGISSINIGSRRNGRNGGSRCRSQQLHNEHHYLQTKNYNRYLENWY